MSRQNEERGFRLFPVFTLKEWLDLLVDKKKIDREKYEEVINFINKSKVKSLKSKLKVKSRKVNKFF
jgi:orotate phosphoribosyltransferase